jgi:hypothetical protein
LSEESKIVKDMAKLVLISGKITEMHEKNMKFYPFIYFFGVKEVKIDYDLSHQSDALVDKDFNLTINAPIRNNVVTYHLTLEDDAKNDQIQKRFAALEASIRTLFWKDIVIEVFINEKLAYKSKE